MDRDEFQTALELAAQNIVADKELKKWRKIWLAVAVIGLLGGAWMYRYDVLMSNGAPYLRLDRWTGHVDGCNSEGCFSFNSEVKGPAPKPTY